MKSLLAQLEGPFVWMLRIPHGARVLVRGPSAPVEHDARGFLDHALELSGATLTEVGDYRSTLLVTVRGEAAAGVFKATAWDLIETFGVTR